jgi:hypothetical protein
MWLAAAAPDPQPRKQSMNKLTPTLSLAALMAIGSTAAHAAPVPSTVATTPGSDFAVSALQTSASTGATLGGIVVTVTFADTSTSSGIWAATGAESGRAFGDGWSLALDGFSHLNPWGLSNTGKQGTIVGFSIDAVPGSASFDMVRGSFLTPGSENGVPFEEVTDSLGTVTGAHAVYSNRLFVGGTFYGDMYEMLSVSLVGGLQADGLLEFFMDTDSVKRGSITSSVPEPETYALMLAGLGIVAYVARRRRV